MPEDHTGEYINVGDVSKFKKSSVLTGFASLFDSDGNGNSFPWAYVSIGVIALVGAGFFVFYFMRVHSGHPKPSFGGTGSSSSSPLAQSVSFPVFVDGSDKDFDKRIQIAEKKIMEAQGELSKLKNRSKIEDLRKKLAQDQDALKRLEEGN